MKRSGRRDWQKGLPERSQCGDTEISEHIPGGFSDLLTCVFDGQPNLQCGNESVSRDIIGEELTVSKATLGCPAGKRTEVRM